jgi:outer membrane protein assembly factor BamB
MGDRERDGGTAQFVTAFDEADQSELWSTRVGPPHRDGSRCTPTIADGFVYALGTGGDLVCLEAATGAVRWKKNMSSDFGGRMMSGWRWSESPLVDGDKLVCTPGADDAMLVALNKDTGDLIWKCVMPDIGDRGKAGAGYASIVAADIDGVRQYITIVGRGAIGVAADTGKFLWGGISRAAGRFRHRDSGCTRPYHHRRCALCGRPED